MQNSKTKLHQYKMGPFVVPCLQILSHKGATMKIIDKKIVIIYNDVEVIYFLFFLLMQNRGKGKYERKPA